MFQVHDRKTCRLCGGARLERYLTIDDMPMSDQFLRPGELGKEFRHRLDIYVCEDCKLSQTLHDVDPGAYYKDYQYSVAQSQHAMNCMQALAESMIARFELKPGNRVLEVGSADGSQLRFFQKAGFEVLGYEPSEALTRVARENGIATINNLFTADSIDDIPAEFKPIQAILLTYTFDHLPDPVAFLRAAAAVLDPENGVLVIEVHDLDKILDRYEYCLMMHEHTNYCGAATMQRLLEKGGMTLIDVDLVPPEKTRGNSLLAAAALKGSAMAKRAMPDLALGRLQDIETYRRFGQEVEQSIATLRRQLREKKKAGMRLAGYGAGGRGVLTMAAIAEPGIFDYVIDKNPAFHNLVTPVSHVPVDGIDRVFKDPVDEILVFSHGYINEIRRDLQPFIDRGGRIISLLDALQSR